MNRSMRLSVPLCPPQRGFSLLELMVVLSLALALAALALPSFRSLAVRWSLQAEGQALVDDLRFARTQAVTLGQPVSICPSTDGTVCATHADWGRGWLVFMDADASRTLTPGKRLLRQHQPASAVQSISSNATSARAGLTYQPTGAARAAGQTVRLTGRGSGWRLVCISMQGRASLRPQGQTQCV
jgi:type IV fimbrial biogenesis protein FimT